MYSLKYRLFLFILFFGGASWQLAVAQSKSNSTYKVIKQAAFKGPVVSIYTSSQAGDRLTKKGSVEFTSKWMDTSNKVN